MIRYLRGYVIAKSKQHIVIDVNGVGYDCFVTPTTLTHAFDEKEHEFHISESIREDAHDLYAFVTVGERDSFELLRKVSGVGPKAALAITGFYAPSDLSGVIASGDSTKLSLVPGIGPKLASKIILELKGKSVTLQQESPTGDMDTIAALESLGYSPSEIAHVLPKIPSSLESTNERITWVLRHFAG